MPLPRRARTVPKPLLSFLLLISLLSVAFAQEFALQTAQLAAIEPSVVLQAQRDVAGDDLSGKDGPLARIGFDLALLYRGFEGGELAAVRAVNPLLRVADGRVVVDFVARGSADALLADLEALGLENGVAFGRYVSGLLPIAALADAAALGSLNHGRASMATTSVGLVDSQGDAAMRSDDARSTFGVDGSGVTIGTLSDSYDCLGGAATDVSNGDLPAGIVVLDEEDGCGSGSDEGRGMMQLIADVAPGSAQQFHTAFDGIASFAQGILDLAAAGSDVIVDDVIYFGEAMFQDDIVAQAADTVVAGGVPFFSSAGNSARQSYESAFRAASAGLLPAVISGIDYTPHDFDPGGGVDILQSLSVPNGASVRLALQWDQPYFSISGAPGPANDIDVYLFDSAGTSILASSADDNTNSDPFEFFSYTNSTGSTETVNVLIAKFNPNGGPDPGLLKYVLFSGNSVVFSEYGTSSATSYGHANATHAASIAAAFFGETPEFGQTPPLLEPFSSGGGVEILFDTSGNPINDLRDKPQFTGPDGTNTTFFGSDIGFDADAFPNFFGTSAAAPHVAAVAALMLEANASLTPDEVYQHLADSAIDMGPAGFDFDSGAGLIQADVAVGAAADPGTLAFTSTSYSVDEGDGTASVTVSRSGGTFGAVSVDLATADGTATAGSDYTATSTTLNWADGDGSDKSATITIVDDLDNEGDETVSLSLSNPTGSAVLGLSGATLTIADNDTPSTLAFASASVTVDEAAGTATVTVTRSASSSGAVSVDYQTADGTATAGSDYTAASGTLSWADGDSADKSFTVPIVDDALVEGDETVSLSLSNPTGNAVLGLDSATLTIADDERSTLNLALGTNSPSGTVNASPGDEVVVMQIDAVVPAGSGSVSVDGVTVQAAPLSTTDVAPQQASLSDIVAVNVYLDSDGDGAIDVGETLLGSAAPGAGGTAVVAFTAGADADVGSAPSLLVSYQIASTISRTVGNGGLALLLAPLGIGLAARLRRRRLALLALLLALLLTACPAPGPQPPTPRSFSSSLAAVDASGSAPGLPVDVNGLPVAGANVRVAP